MESLRNEGFAVLQQAPLDETIAGTLRYPSYREGMAPAATGLLVVSS